LRATSDEAICRRCNARNRAIEPQVAPKGAATDDQSRVSGNPEGEDYMRHQLRRFLAAALFAVTIGGTSADAAPINVAEFRWDTFDIDTDIVLSLFSLTNIWDGDEPGPTIFGNQLTLASGAQFWSDLAPPFPVGGANTEQLFDLGVLPTLAQVSISFLLGADVITLTGTLTQANTAIVLQYDVPDTQPIPEPSTLTLMGLGALAVARAARRRRHHQRH
jgi:hypothetical protein